MRTVWRGEWRRKMKSERGRGERKGGGRGEKEREGDWREEKGHDTGKKEAKWRIL